MAETTDDDAVLVARIARGSEAAFGVLYRRYLPLVMRWSLRQTADREVAADLAAEVFAAALIASRRYAPEQGSVAAWLLGIAKNKLRESRRRRRIEDAARRKLGLEPLTLTDADLDRVDELASLDADILALVASLPEDQRDALMARVVAERSYEEIAEELRCSPSVVRQRVSRGLRTLRSEMEER
ncbi:MAG: RNA polymerase sigma factor [Solirubrobacteraceae bacterium]